METNNANVHNYDNNEHSDPTLHNSYDSKPNWLKGSWRAPLGDVGALIVYLDDEYASVKIMNGFNLVQSITYDNWFIFDNMVYLALNGEKLKDSPSFYIDYNNRILIGHDGARFEKH